MHLSSCHAKLVLGAAREGSKRETESTHGLLSSRLRTGQFHLILLVKAGHEIIPSIDGRCCRVLSQLLEGEDWCP